MTDLYTIGFAKKGAEQFFGLLGKHGIRLVIDVRLNNVSQLAGFTKSADLRYFLRTILDCGYLHLTPLAPTQDILEGYKGKRMSWETYEREFTELLAARQVETLVDASILHKACLLCSEPEAMRCHRRLVAEYLQGKFPGVSITHL